MINVMSFNIRTASARDGKHCWEYRRQLVLERIRLYDPDLLGVQECRNDTQAEFMKTSLADYVFIGYERGGKDDTAIEMAPILIKRSAFQVLDAGCFWLSETPGVPGSLSWGSYFPRTVTWAKLIAKQEQGRVLYFFNTHFDYANLQVQVESAELLKKHIASLRNRPPVILCGDFNIEKDSTPYQALLEEDFIPMHDCYRAANPGPWKDEGTFHDFGTLSKPQVLDWILISSNFHTVASDIDRYQLGDLFPSDHFPLTTRVSW